LTVCVFYSWQAVIHNLKILDLIMTIGKIFFGICITLCLITIGSLYYIFLERKLNYPYDVTQDYQYDFKETDATISELSFNNGLIFIPAQSSSSKTAFLKVNVSSSLKGEFFRPNIEVSGDGKSFVQFFAHGVEGVRYLNISQFISKDGTSINLKTNNLSIKDETLQFIQFDNEVTENKKILILSPHPDDAEIAAFGFYSTHKDVHIVTVTAGEAGDFVYNELYDDEVEHFLKKGEIRTWNSITVPMLGGVVPERSINLGFFDGTIKSLSDDKSRIGEGNYTKTTDINTFRKQNISSLAVGLGGVNNWNSLVNNLVYILETIKPDVILAPSPSLDNHTDHQYSFHALVEALKSINKRDGHIYLYTNHLTVNEAYPYGDTGSVVSLPPSFKENNFFTKVYSHPLKKEQQQSKTLVLDAMNDLRQDTEYRFYKPVLKGFFYLLRDYIFDRDNSYFRRAVRSNELFFVIETKDIYNDEKLSKL
jgi:LmbE family N-acetylglucosaminyl deacetylase